MACCKGGCCIGWLSGVFSLAAICALIHIIGGGWCLMCKLTGSVGVWIVFIVAAVLAIIFGLIAHKKGKETTAPTG